MGHTELGVELYMGMWCRNTRETSKPVRLVKSTSRASEGSPLLTTVQRGLTERFTGTGRCQKNNQRWNVITMCQFVQLSDYYI